MTRSIKTRTLSLLLAFVSVFTVFGVFASSKAVSAAEITPYYNNTVSATSSANISSTGKITISNSYSGIKDVTTKAVITTYIEKRFLGIFWTRVDIGTTDDEWVDTVYNYQYTGNHTFQLESTGTYRVTVEYVISGSGGSADEIIKEIEVKY